MADTKISDLTDGNPVGPADQFIIARSGSDYRLNGLTSVLLYDYTVTGSDKASIDTGVDTPDAGIAGTSAFAAGRVLEVYLYARTDEAVAFSTINGLFNNDGSSVYSRQRVRGSATTASASSATNEAVMNFSVHGASATAGIFSLHTLVMHNYAGTVAAKAFTYEQNLCDKAATMIIDLWGCVYLPASPAAVTRYSVTPATAGKKFKVGTRLTILAR